MHLIHTRTPDILETELPTCWLAHTTPPSLDPPVRRDEDEAAGHRRRLHDWKWIRLQFTDWDVNFLCNLGLTTVSAVHEWASTLPANPERAFDWTSTHLGRHRTPREHYQWKWDELNIDARYAPALENLRREGTDLNGDPDVEQAPWPAVDGHTHPSVLMNVDGSKFTEPRVTAGAGVLVHKSDWKHWRDGPPILEHICRCLGSQTSNRSETLALLIGLRSCRSVPKIHCMTDSQFVKDGVDKFMQQGIQSATNQTAHRDLLRAIVKELADRDQLYPPGHFYLEKVRSHQEDTPITHEDVDELAKKAAKLPLPEHWRHILSPHYTVLSGGLTHNEYELRTLLVQRICEREVADLPVHLRHLAEPSLDHSLSLQLWNHLKHPSISESLLRLRFGITRVHSTHTPGLGHACNHCTQSIRGADGMPITDNNLHGTDYVSHILFECPANAGQRDEIQTQCDTFTANLRKKLGEQVPAFCMNNAVADALLQRTGSADLIRVDPRGFCNDTIRRQLSDAGADMYDLAELYTACEPALHATLRLAAFGRQDAAATRPAA